MRLLKFVMLALLITGAALSAMGRTHADRHFFDKIINRYDVADTVMNAPDAGMFWQLLQTTDPQYRKTASSLAKDRKNRDIKRDMVSLMSSSRQYFATVPTDESLYDMNEMIMGRLGVRDVLPTAILSVTAENDVALFSYPNGYFFATRPLWEQVGSDTVAMTALMAAESTHFVLQHAYANAARQKSMARRKRLGRIFGAVALTAAGVIIDQAMGNEWMPFTELASIVSVGLVSMDSNPRYTFHYSPEQTYQADIVAYRFMEWAGYGGRAYIDALRMAGFHLDAQSQQPADAPDMATRISLLEYLDRMPKTGSHASNAGRQPRPVKNYDNIFVLKN